MYHKSVVATFKAHQTPGQFEALFSRFDNIDLDGDIIRKGAFEPALDANPNPAIVWTHRWDIPPIGETLEAGETKDGARAVGRLFLKEHPVAQQVWAGLKSGALRQFSFSFDLADAKLRDPEDEEKAVRHDGKIQELLKFSAVHEWGPTLVGANPQTALLSAKSLSVLLGLDQMGIDLSAYKNISDDPLPVIEGEIEGKPVGTPDEQQKPPEGDTGDEDEDDEKEAPDPDAVTALLAERPMVHLHS
jgi:HK97 family phage prohead protease